jgi:TonB family protein
MVSLLPERMNSLRVFRPGKDGVGYPKCASCPNPEYSDDARAQKLQGRVLLLVTITPEGRATNIVVLKRAGHGLDERAIEAVRKWRFNPAPGPDGKPVPVRVPIQITFQFL